MRYMPRQSSPAALLFSTSFLVLLICCVNAALFVLTDTMSRRAEFAVRMAVGATRARIIRQVLTEISIKWFIGAAAGVLTDKQFEAATGKKKTETQKLRYEVNQLKSEIKQIKAMIQELKESLQK